MGRTPKPTNIERAEGNPGHRPINTREPKPMEVRPQMPRYLDAQARKEWRRLCPMLERMRVLTEADGIGLASLCVDYSLLQQVQADLAKTGLLVKNSKTGMIHQNPLLNIASVVSGRVARGLREFGLTPASRSKIQVAGNETKDNFLALLATPRAPSVRPN